MDQFTALFNKAVDEKVASIKAEYEAKIAALEAKLEPPKLTPEQVFENKFDALDHPTMSSEYKDRQLYDLYIDIFKYLYNNNAKVSEDLQSFQESYFDGCNLSGLLISIYHTITDDRDTTDNKIHQLLHKSGFRMVDLTPLAIIPQKSSETSDEYIVRLLKHNDIDLVHNDWESEDNIHVAFLKIIGNGAVSIQSAHRMLTWLYNKN